MRLAISIFVLTLVVLTTAGPVPKKVVKKSANPESRQEIKDSTVSQELKVTNEPSDVKSADRTKKQATICCIDVRPTGANAPCAGPNGQPCPPCPIGEAPPEPQIVYGSPSIITVSQQPNPSVSQLQTGYYKNPGATLPQKSTFIIPGFPQPVLPTQPQTDQQPGLNAGPFAPTGPEPIPQQPSNTRPSDRVIPIYIPAPKAELCKPHVVNVPYPVIPKINCEYSFANAKLDNQGISDTINVQPSPSFPQSPETPLVLPGLSPGNGGTGINNLLYNQQPAPVNTVNPVEINFEAIPQQPQQPQKDADCWCNVHPLTQEYHLPFHIGNANEALNQQSVVDYLEAFGQSQGTPQARTASHIPQVQFAQVPVQVSQAPQAAPAPQGVRYNYVYNVPRPTYQTQARSNPSTSDCNSQSPYQFRIPRESQDEQKAQVLENEVIAEDAEHSKMNNKPYLMKRSSPPDQAAVDQNKHEATTPKM